MANNQQLLLGEGAGGAPVVYIEDVFSTYLYTGNGSTQTITNNIDLSTKGGLVWYKARALGYEHELVDTARGAGFNLETPNTTASTSRSTALTAFNTTGFTLGNNVAANGSGDTFVSWTFREQPKFFDVVTYTGTGSNTTIAHTLGVVPGCIIVKRTDTTAAWAVYHRSLANTEYLVLNTTAAKATGATWWNSTTPTSAVFSVGTDATVNASGGTYVAYLFAHDAGGFGLAGTDNVITCGSAVVNGSGAINVTLGYEPQWVLLKNATTAGNWFLQDSMRGYTVQVNNPTLKPNLSDAETSSGYSQPNATGFSTPNGTLGSGDTYIYIAIRRGPMKVPTVGTSVYESGTRGTAQATAAGVKYYSGFPVDWVFNCNRTFAGHDTTVYDRLRGAPFLATNLTSAESTGGTFLLASNLGFDTGTTSANLNQSAWMFQRAPGFFDEVCYKVTSGSQAISHNLGVTPELIIYKNRSAVAPWYVWTTGYSTNKYLNLNNAQGQQTYTLWGTMSSTIFTVVDSGSGGDNIVAYLFATCAGVSKVGSYTGNGSSQTIACGFTAGSRFVMIRRTDAGIGGDWYVWDSARGIVAGNDPHLSLNDTAAEVTTDDSVDTDNSGFIVNQLSATNVNVTSATYIFLAIA